MLIFAFCFNSVYAAENVVLITLDGLRWQELFRGLDPVLVNHDDFSGQSALLNERFGQSQAAQSAAAIFPFIHGTVCEQGSYIGNRDESSCAAVSNPDCSTSAMVKPTILPMTASMTNTCWRPTALINSLLKCGTHCNPWISIATIPCCS